MKDYLPGRKISPMPALAASRAATRQAFPVLGAPHSQPNEDDGPRIESIREGDKVVRLVITCSCGERIEVECLYPAGA